MAKFSRSPERLGGEMRREVGVVPVVLGGQADSGARRLHTLCVGRVYRARVGAHLHDYGIGVRMIGDGVRTARDNGTES